MRTEAEPAEIMEKTFITTRKRVETLVDILAHQVSLLLPRDLRQPFLEEAGRHAAVYFRTNAGRRIVEQTGRSAVDELAVIEKAIFHISGRLRDWINSQEAKGNHGGADKKQSREGPGRPGDGQEALGERD